MSIYLPVRPRPAAVESLRGYLMRVATQNGCTRPREFLKLFGLAEWHWQRHDDAIDVEACLFSLETALRLPRHSLRQLMDQGRWTSLLDSNPEWSRRRPRICPACLLEADVLHAEWEFAPLTVCPKHHCVLLDECPQCETLLKWDRPHFLTCHHCYTRLSSWPTQLTSIGLQHAERIRELWNDWAQLQQYVSDLQQAAHHIARAVDFFPAQIPFDTMPNQQLVLLYENAHRFLLSPDRLQQMDRYRREQLKAVNAIGRHAMFHRETIDDTFCGAYATTDAVPPIDFAALRTQRLAYARQYPARHRQQLAEQLWVNPQRLRGLPFNDAAAVEDTLCHQVTRSQIATIMGIPHQEERIVSELMPSQNPLVAHRSDAMYNLRTLHQLLLRIPVQPGKRDRQIVPLLSEHLRLELPLYAASYANIVRFALEQHTLRCWRIDHEGGFDSVVCDVQEREGALEAHLSTLTQNLTVRQLAAVFRVDNFCITELINQNHLLTNHWQQRDLSNTEVVNASWQGFHKRYLVLNRWGRRHRMMAGRLIKVLARNALHPAITIYSSHTQRGFWIYRRTPKLLAVLERRAVTPWWHRGM